MAYDNYYCKRFCGDPIRLDWSLNVIAMLVLHTTNHAMYQRFPTLDDLLRRIPEAAQAIATTSSGVPTSTGSFEARSTGGTIHTGPP